MELFGWGEVPWVAIECPCGWEDSPYTYAQVGLPTVGDDFQLGFVKEELSQAALEHGYKTKFTPQLKDLFQKLVSKKTCPGCKVALTLIEMDDSFMAGCPKCGVHKTINLK